MDSLDEEGYSTAIKVKYLALYFVSSPSVIGSYLPTFRWKRLAAAVKYIHKFDGMVGKPLYWPCQTKRRIVIGLAIGLTSAIASVRMAILFLITACFLV